MARDDKLLARMRANPRGDWTIDDVLRVARQEGLSVRRPSGGSHYVLGSRVLAHKLAVPYHRPIKDVYVRRLVLFVDDHRAASPGGSHA